METPYYKRTNLSFINRSNLFSCSGQINDFFNFKDNNTFSPFESSVNKYFITSYKRPGTKNDTQDQNKLIKSSSVNLDKENNKEIYKLNVKKSSFKISNINFHIKYSYINGKNALTGSTFQSTDIKYKNFFSEHSSDVKKNLLSKLQEDRISSEDIRLKLDDKFVKSYHEEFNTEKLACIRDQQLLKNNEQINEDIEDKLDYILNPENNIKREYTKIKKSNSCRCAKTGCSKFSCNCLRNGLKCDILCKCKNCNNCIDNKSPNLIELLCKKTSRE